MAVSAVDLLYVFGKSLVMFDQITLLFSSVLELTSVFDGNHCVSLILSVVPRRGLQQCHNNISVFILV